MAWPHTLRATIPLNTTVDWGLCDRCYFLYDLEMLQFQFDQRGSSVQSLGIRVCPRCYDSVATTLAPIRILGPESVVRDPRPPQYAANAAGGTGAPADVGTFLFPNEVPP